MYGLSSPGRRDGPLVLGLTPFTPSVPGGGGVLLYADGFGDHGVAIATARQRGGLELASKSGCPRVYIGNDGSDNSHRNWLQDIQDRQPRRAIVARHAHVTASNVRY